MVTSYHYHIRKCPVSYPGLLTPAFVACSTNTRESLATCDDVPGDRVASYPGLLTPAFVACNTNMGEDLVKLSHVQWRTWMCGGVAHFWISRKYVSVLPITNRNRRTTEHSTSDSLCDISWVQKAALQLYRKNVPLLYMSRYIIARDSVLPGLPPR